MVLLPPIPPKKTLILLDIPDIERLSELNYLKELELNGNALSRRPGYRHAVLNKLPNLLYLDGRVII
jgi:hypothetical protein